MNTIISELLYLVGMATPQTMERQRQLLVIVDKRETILRTALGFYSDPLNWENETVDIGVGEMPIPLSSPAANDGGMRARKAIEELYAISPDGARV